LVSHSRSSMVKWTKGAIRITQAEPIFPEYKFYVVLIAADYTSP
jgi:hypothetical protein